MGNPVQSVAGTTREAKKANKMLLVVGGLDAFQGHPTFFRREEIVLEGPEGPAIAWTFRVAHQGGTFVRPTDAYLNRIKGAIRQHGLPPEALDIVDSAARPPGKPSIST